MLAFFIVIPFIGLGFLELVFAIEKRIKDETYL